jgi:hypothetical protein
MTPNAPLDPWAEARDVAREDVRAIFAPEPRTCPACGKTSETAARNCPQCGASYVLIRQPLSKRTKRIIGGIVLVVLIAIAIAAAMARPGIEKVKKDNASRDAAAHAQAVAEKRRIATIQQRPRTARVAAGTSLVAGLEQLVDADAKQRSASGELKGNIQRARCEPYPRSSVRQAQEGDPAFPRNTYSCTAVTAVIEQSDAHVGGGLVGHPFLAVIDHRTRRVTWCKVNPPPGEQAIGQGALVPLSPRCIRP